MQQIINFLLRYKISLLYVFLLSISLGFTIHSHSYHKSKFFNSANFVTGGIYNTSSNITSYFGLRKENKNLVEENTRLRRLLFNSGLNDSIEIDTAKVNYTVMSAYAIKNSYGASMNYITIDRGKNDSVKQDMGVITSKGILGIIEGTSPKFARVQSILNTKSNINAKIKNTDYFGSLKWDTNAYNVVQLEDIPRLVPLHIGDTIVTGASSSIFPEGIDIGVIKKFDLNSSKSLYSIDIELFNDMANIKNVYIINNINRPEIQQLEEEIKNDQ